MGVVGVVGRDSLHAPIHGFDVGDERLGDGGEAAGERADFVR